MIFSSYTTLSQQQILGVIIKKLISEFSVLMNKPAPVRFLCGFALLCRWRYRALATASRFAFKDSMATRVMG
jgi:hypothetical protein